MVELMGLHNRANQVLLWLLGLLQGDSSCLMRVTAAWQVEASLYSYSPCCPFLRQDGTKAWTRESHDCPCIIIGSLICFVVKRFNFDLLYEILVNLRDLDTELD